MRREATGGVLAVLLVLTLIGCGSDDPSTVATEGDGDRPESTTSLTVDPATTLTTMPGTSTTADPDTPVSDDDDSPPTTVAPVTTTTTTTPPPQGGGTVDPRKHGWDSAEVLLDGRTVRVTYYAGVCDALDHVDVAKNPEAVTITLWVGRKPDAQEACIEIAEERTGDVDVGEPVAGRELRDGADA